MKRSISALAAAVACAAACAGPAAASTARATSATQLCSKVSASSVSSIIGYTVPAAVGTSLSEKATKESDGIAGSTLNCMFGSVKSLAALKKSISVSFETLSKSVSAAEVKVLVEKTAATVGSKAKIVPVSALGNEAYLMTFSEGGISIDSLIAADGTKLYGATDEQGLSTSKLVSLVKLAQKL